MEKLLRGLQPTDIKGHSTWFWYKEGVATVNTAYAIIRRHRFRAKSEILWAIGFILISPLIYFVLPFVTVLFAERNIIRGMKENDRGGSVQFCSKGAIEHFTILSNLRRTG